jgi:quinol monooxygenase YgiN
MSVRPGQLDGFTRQAAECIRLTRELDTGTLRYDWFLRDDGAACEVREAYTAPRRWSSTAPTSNPRCTPCSSGMPTTTR